MTKHWFVIIFLLLGAAGRSHGQVPGAIGSPSLDGPSAGMDAAAPDPSLQLEHARARFRFGLSQHSGSLQDLGPTLTFSGLTPNDMGLSLSGYTRSFFGGWLALQREGLSLYRGEQLVAQRGLMRLTVAPAARFRIRTLRLEGAAGYQFTQLPSFPDSQNTSLAPAQRHAAFVGFRGTLPLTRRLSLEGAADLPITLSATDAVGQKAKSNGFSASMGILMAVARTHNLGWGIGADYQWVRDTVTAASGAVGTQTIHRLGLSLDISLLPALPVLARIEPPPVVEVPPPTPKPGLLRVTVKHASTGEPLASATVNVGGIEHVTGPDGIAQIADMAMGPTQVAVAAAGFKPATEVAAMADGLDTDVTILMQPEGKKLPATLAGHTRSRPNGAPVEAVLRVLNTDLHTRSNAEGAFALQLEAGTYRIIISAPGYRAQRKTVSLREGEQAIFNVDLHPQAP